MFKVSPYIWSIVKEVSCAFLALNGRGPPSFFMYSQLSGVMYEWVFWWVVCHACVPVPLGCGEAGLAAPEPPDSLAASTGCNINHLPSVWAYDNNNDNNWIYIAHMSH